MFLYTRGDRKYIQIENDVLRIITHLLRQYLIGPVTDVHFPSHRIRLPGLVKGHHDDRRAITFTDDRLLDEFRLSFLHGNRIDDTLALYAFQPRLDDRELRRVDNDRYHRN